MAIFIRHNTHHHKNYNVMVYIGDHTDGKHGLRINRTLCLAAAWISSVWFSQKKKTEDSQQQQQQQQLRSNLISDTPLKLVRRIQILN